MIVVSHDRYFMDKVVDHLLVFQGNGVIRDFPGNYTQYRQWQSLKTSQPDQSVRTNQNSQTSQMSKTSSPRPSGDKPSRRKFTYKEKMEFERLEREIADLEAEQRQLEEALCSGTLSVEELTEKSKRLPILKDELDEKSLRWLELSEIEQ